MANTRVKICGLREAEHVSASVAAGAAYVGFNFVTRSPRYVDPATARDLAVEVPMGVAKVSLTLDADDAELDAILNAVPIDMVQLHGSETPARVAEVKERFGLPVMKAVGVATDADLDALAAYEDVADQILVDAKPAKGGALPGGNGVTFDWRLIAGRSWKTPWMLAGGLTVDNVADAIRLTGAQQIDLASGVESAPGQKDAGLIRAFMAAVDAA